jgi:DME family drug/metabolite transporter
MQFLYKIPGYILLLFGGFCLSWGGLVIKSFEEASVWQILLLRSAFFMVALIAFLIVTYKKNTIKILKDAGLPAVLGGLVMSLSFIAFVVAMTNTTVANVVFIISTQTMFLAIFGYFYLKEKVSLVSFISILLAMSGITVMIGDSLSSGSFFGNLVALAIPINFSILVMIIRKNKNLDMVPAIFYSGIFSGYHN